mmetsp:Transcript_32264/g.81175  ORF Transcript_32264/g.81175 Transcript_32264/m.81175 type:complete len:244 (-) Transcript_32264:95-826(-)
MEARLCCVDTFLRSRVSRPLLYPPGPVRPTPCRPEKSPDELRRWCPECPWRPEAPKAPRVAVACAMSGVRSAAASTAAAPRSSACMSTSRRRTCSTLVTAVDEATRVMAALRSTMRDSSSSMVRTPATTLALIRSPLLSGVSRAVAAAAAAATTVDSAGWAEGDGAAAVSASTPASASAAASAAGNDVPMSGPAAAAAAAAAVVSIEGGASIRSSYSGFIHIDPPLPDNSPCRSSPPPPNPPC